ncbi:MAG: SAM-dependent methyltransferase [Limisphaerales bacterium]
MGHPPESSHNPATADVPSPAVERFLDHVDASLADGAFVRLVLSRPTPASGDVTRIEGRLIVLRNAPTLSLTLHEARKDSVRNLAVSEARPWLSRTLGAQFESAFLESTRQDWQLMLANPRSHRLVAHSPRRTTAPDRSHDRPRPVSLDASARDWMAALGLTDEQGRPLPKRADKVRQILRYAEILGHLLKETDLESSPPIHVADMGCGRGALTFAAWQLLHRQMGLPAEVVGVELRPDLAAEAQRTVERLGLESIRFRAGSIEDAEFGANQVDILIALHACNTATDDALRRGVQLGSRLILVAPCCHQELRPGLGRPELFAPLLDHGIFGERFAEWLTDGLRVLALEAAGYHTKAIEFIGSEHTPKNLLIAGIRSGDSPGSERRSRAREQLRALKDHFHPGHLALDAIPYSPPA